MKRHGLTFHGAIAADKQYFSENLTGLDVKIEHEFMFDNKDLPSGEPVGDY